MAQEDGYAALYSMLSREDPFRKNVARKLDEFSGTDHGKGKTISQTRSVDVASLLTSITYSTNEDMHRYACSEAIDCMRAYYKIITLISKRGPVVVHSEISVNVDITRKSDLNPSLVIKQVAIKTLIDKFSVLVQE